MPPPPKKKNNHFFVTDHFRNWVAYQNNFYKKQNVIFLFEADTKEIRNFKSLQLFSDFKCMKKKVKKKKKAFVFSFYLPIFSALLSKIQPLVLKKAKGNSSLEVKNIWIINK